MFDYNRIDKRSVVFDEKKWLRILDALEVAYEEANPELTVEEVDALANEIREQLGLGPRKRAWD